MLRLPKVALVSASVLLKLPVSLARLVTLDDWIVIGVANTNGLHRVATATARERNTGLGFIAKKSCFDNFGEKQVFLFLTCFRNPPYR